mgnify:CR=1 FL=1
MEETTTTQPFIHERDQDQMDAWLAHIREIYQIRAMLIEHSCHCSNLLPALVTLPEAREQLVDLIDTIRDPSLEQAAKAASQIIGIDKSKLMADILVSQYIQGNWG